MYKLEYKYIPFFRSSFIVFFSHSYISRSSEPLFNSSFSLPFVSQNIQRNVTSFLTRAFPFYTLITIFNKFSTLSCVRNSHKDQIWRYTKEKVMPSVTP